MKKVLNFIWGLLKNNLLLKIMAVLFAVVLWSYVLAQTNPVRERTLNNIPVNYDEAVLQDNGLAISHTLSNIVETVDVRVEVEQNSAKYVTETNVTANVKLLNVTSTGELTFEIEASPPYGTVVEVSPSTVTLYIDQYVTSPGAGSAGDHG